MRDWLFLFGWLWWLSDLFSGGRAAAEGEDAVSRYNRSLRETQEPRRPRRRNKNWPYPDNPKP